MSSLRLDSDARVVECGTCGQRNRIPADRLADDGSCGKCGSALPPIDVPVEITGPAQLERLACSTKPVLVDFHATWCGPCRQVAPELEKLAKTAAGQMLVAKVDVDAVPELAERFRVASVPTISVMRNGREVGRTMGAQPAAALAQLVSRSR